MRLPRLLAFVAVLAACAPSARAPSVPAAPSPAPAPAPAPGEPAPPPQQPLDSGIIALVKRLELDRYKSTILGLTQFGDRRQGTDRNRAAVDWIEAQLKSYGCSNTERIHYEYTGRQLRLPGDSTPPRRPATPRVQLPPKGFRARTGVNTNPDLQPDTALRRINAQRDEPGPREEVYCTKIGATHPGEMYIVGGHMDGHGFGSAANDDGSGTALVMELEIGRAHV